MSLRKLVSSILVNRGILCQPITANSILMQISKRNLHKMGTKPPKILITGK